MGIKGLWKWIKANYHFTNGIDAPIIVRYCDKHKRYEWYDACNRWGGIAYSLESLKRSLQKLYRCGNCGSYHVFDVAIVSSAEDLQIEFKDFIDFISE